MKREGRGSLGSLALVLGHERIVLWAPKKMESEELLGLLLGYEENLR